MSSATLSRFGATLDQIRADGLFKGERIITSPQSAEIELADGRRVLNFCANNYLGLADHPRVIDAAKRALDSHGFGMASVRFICGTQDLHKQLEKTIADFFGTEDTILYAACFDANGGLFEPLLDENDAIISDALNHASIIDGVRLCKAKRYRYANCDMADLEKQLQQAKADGARTIMITSDGVFSMDGFIAPLDEMSALAAEDGGLGHIGQQGGRVVGEHAAACIGGVHGAADARVARAEVAARVVAGRSVFGDGLLLALPGPLAAVGRDEHPLAGQRIAAPVRMLGRLEGGGTGGCHGCGRNSEGGGSPMPEGRARIMAQRRAGRLRCNDRSTNSSRPLRL